MLIFILLILLVLHFININIFFFVFKCFVCINHTLHVYRKPLEKRKARSNARILFKDIQINDELRKMIHDKRKLNNFSTEKILLTEAYILRKICMFLQFIKFVERNQ